MTTCTSTHTSNCNILPHHIQVVRAKHHLHTMWGLDQADPDAELPLELTAPGPIRVNLGDHRFSVVVGGLWLNVWIEVERLWRWTGDHSLNLVTDFQATTDDRPGVILTPIWGRYDGVELPWTETPDSEDYRYRPELEAGVLAYLEEVFGHKIAA